MSLIAAQISSVLTAITSSTHSRAMRNASAPICLTATPSANSDTLSSTTRSPAAAADRNEDGVDRRCALAQDLRRDRALPGDHLRVVVGMNEHAVVHGR